MDGGRPVLLRSTSEVELLTQFAVGCRLSRSSTRIAGAREWSVLRKKIHKDARALVGYRDIRDLASTISISFRRTKTRSDATVRRMAKAAVRLLLPLADRFRIYWQASTGKVHWNYLWSRRWFVIAFVCEIILASLISFASGPTA